MNRRSFLTLAGTSVSVGLAGCLQKGPTQASEASGDPPETATPPTQFQYDAQNSGVTSGTAPETASVRWHTTVSPIDGGLSISDGRVVIAAGGELVALDADDGAKLWAVDVGHSTPAAPALTVDTAYVTTWNGGPQHDRGVAAIALEDGSERWRAIPDVDVTSAPTLENDSVYVGGSLNSTEVIALDIADGAERWRFEAGQYATTPAVAEGTVYVGGGSEHVAYALDAETGDEVWRFETDAGVWGAPTVVDDTVYVGSRDGRLYALESVNGSEQWTVQVGSSVHSSVAATDGRVYVSAEETITALDAEGNKRWSVEATDGGYAPTVAANAVVVADRMDAFCLDATDGHELWRRAGEQRSISDMTFVGIGCEPVVADGFVVVASHGGDVHALQEET